MRHEANRSSSEEWLVTNGLGGYAFGSAHGVPTRSYHGLLIVARKPPVDRCVIVAGLTERVGPVGGERIDLSALEHLRGWRLDGRHPVFTYFIDGMTLDKRVWMAHGKHTTYIRYELIAGVGALDLELTPMLTERDHHAVRNHQPGDPPPADLRILLDGHPVEVRPIGVVRTRLHEETARGLLDETDALAVAPISARLGPGEAVTLTLTVEADEPVDAISALAETRQRDARLLAAAGAAGAAGTAGSAGAAGAEAASSFVQRLVLGADAFVVQRDVDGVPDGRTVIAGYPWFNDWGRDTMIALPGLCLATGRHDEARSILRAFARFVRDGLIPNDFPDDAQVDPGYHTMDATLWFVQAVRAYVATVTSTGKATGKTTGDDAFLAELLPTIRAIVDAHHTGTRFGIGMDGADGLLHGGADGVQLTWMDAKVDGWVVTPRRGKPVEIQALWINALRAFSAWSGEASYAAIADAATDSFRARFWRPELGYLADVVDGPDGDDTSLRPNQLLALSLPHPLVDVPIARSVLAAVQRELAVPLGLRSLAPSDPAYRPDFQGDRRFRDSGYHQGTVWTWLIGPYADAVARFGGGPAAARAILKPFQAHLDEAGLGSVSEILEPEPPFAPRGCPFQAWGVAEVLRAWRAYGGT